MVTTVWISASDARWNTFAHKYLPLYIARYIHTAELTGAM